MAHIKFNSFNPGAYNSFVPLATKKSNGKVLRNVLGLAAFGLFIWWITRPSKQGSQDDVTSKEE
jgi:hypothetical protein